MAPKKVMKTMKKKKDLEKSPKKKGLEKPSNQRGLEKSSGRKGLEKPMKKPGCNDGGGLEKNQEPSKTRSKLQLRRLKVMQARVLQSCMDLCPSLIRANSGPSTRHPSEGTRPWKRPMPNLARRRKELLLANGSWKRKASSFSKPPGGFLWEKLSLRLITGKPISKMLTRYTPEELEMHLQSGKVVWRECPYTSGTFEYKDTQNSHRAVNTARQKEWQCGVEFEPEDEDVEKFMELFSSDCHSLSVDEGLGKGSAKGLGKGQGSLGKGRRGRGKAIKEEDEDEPEPHGKLAKACRAARNMVSATMSDLEEALEKTGSKLTKAGKTTANDLSKKSSHVLGKALATPLHSHICIWGWSGVPNKRYNVGMVMVLFFG